MIGALLYLRFTSLLNLVVHRIRRLRQPKYLVGAAVAAAYFYFVLGHRPGTGAAPGVAGIPGFAGDRQVGFAIICSFLCLLGMVRIAYAWISPPEKPGLRFSEPEIAFLFPAPVTRRTLIHYRLLSAQISILFSAILMAFLFNRFGYAGGSRWRHAIGWWVILSTYDLHLNGTNLTLCRLREKSRHFLLWRLGAVAAMAAYVAAVFWCAIGLVEALLSGMGSARAGSEHFMEQVLDSPALHWLTLPFRIVFGPYAAAGLGDFAAAMVPALLLLAAHYYWVSGTEARFEEGSIALAERRAAIRAAAHRGDIPAMGGAAPKARPGPFPLAPTGVPEMAFLWKNLLSIRSSLFSRRALVLFLVVMTSMLFGPLFSAHASSVGSDAMRKLVVALCGMFAAYTILVGPQLARQDLRNDLPNADILKTYPMEGWRIALGELLAPTAILTAILWFMLLASASALDAGEGAEWLTRGVRLTAVVCLGLAAPLVCLIQLIVPNWIMVLMPGWYQASRSRVGGIETFGQRLMFGVIQLLFALVVIVPAAGAAWLIIFSSQWVIGVGPAVVLAALVVLPILAGEAAFGLWWLGERFEKFDLSTESR
jgi:ABC-2 type transport system permease protein